MGYRYGTIAGHGENKRSRSLFKRVRFDHRELKCSHVVLSHQRQQTTYDLRRDDDYRQFFLSFSLIGDVCLYCSYR